VRPIITSGKSSDPSKASREHQVWVEQGMVSCSGGKLTTFHHMALDVMKKALPFLPPASDASDKRIFDSHSLNGKDILPEDPDRGDRLLGRYGQGAKAMIENAPASERAAIPGTRTCLAQARWAVRHESVVHLDDLMLRRTRLGLLLANGGEQVLADIRQIFEDEAGWTQEVWAAETDRYRRIIREYYTLPGRA
jgi:glycerol-3-phosphate dehydrogenase